MSQRTRTIKWCEGKILKLLARKQEITTYLSLSALALDYEVRNLTEEHQIDIAITNLLSRKTITKTKDKDGFTYRLSA